MEKNKLNANLSVVPWYSSAEWKCVYELIYNKESNDDQRKKALNVINIWKDRVNLLCSGVEGTLIILEALFLNNVDDKTLQTVYSSAIMRFINVCVNVKDRKCTMHDLAKKYNIPTWVVKIRHEFAHDQKLPALFVCKKALHFALDWLKINYWQKEYDNIKDYITEDESASTNQQSLTLFTLFCDLTLASIRNDTNNLKEIPDELVERIRYSIGTELEKGWKQSMVCDIQEELMNRLENFIIDNNSENVTNLLKDYLIESSNVRPDFAELLHKWQTILHKLLDNKIFVQILNKLYKGTCNKFYTKRNRLFCAFWIRELLSILNGFEGGVPVDLLDELKQFLQLVLRQPTLNSREYLTQLLKAAGIAGDSADKINTVFQIYTNGMDFDDEDNEVIMDVDKEESFECAAALNCTKWTLVTDNRFHAVPLGVLPDTRYGCNPLLDDYLLTS